MATRLQFLCRTKTWCTWVLHVDGWQVCGNEDPVAWLLGWLMEWKCGGGGEGEGEVGWINGQLCNTVVLMGPVGVSACLHAAEVVL